MLREFLFRPGLYIGEELSGEAEDYAEIWFSVLVSLVLLMVLFLDSMRLLIC